MSDELKEDHVFTAEGAEELRDRKIESSGDRIIDRLNH
jgi:hypothetical protein